MLILLPSNTIPAIIYLSKVNNGNTRERCEICSQLTIKTPEPRHLWRAASVTETSKIELYAKTTRKLRKNLYCRCFTGF